MKLVWLDLETTGLDPQRHDILEVAVCLAELNDPFVTKGSIEAVLAHTSEEPLDAFVQEMHTKNGLLAECAESETTLEYAENILLDCIPVLPKEERWILAGSLIHFDASFIRELMPRLYERLSHRLYDVSAIKLFCQSLGMPKFPKAEAHRALADVEESITHAKVCAEWLKRKFSGWESVSIRHESFIGGNFVASVPGQMLRTVSSSP